MSVFVAFLIHKDAGLVSDLGRHDEFMDSSIKNELKTETMWKYFLHLFTFIFSYKIRHDEIIVLSIIIVVEKKVQLFWVLLTLLKILFIVIDWDLILNDR